jgi:hypothetical protein
MEKPDDLLFEPSPERKPQGAQLNKILSNPQALPADKRVTQLLLVLHELDQAVAGLECLPQTKLSELVSCAIVGCGFVDPTEAWYAIGAVLQVIEAHEVNPESS